VFFALSIGQMPITLLIDSGLYNWLVV